MADIRPFRGLRFNPSIVDNLGAAMCPPFDVISPDEDAALRKRSPHNAVRIELAQGNNTPEAYASAAKTLQEWRQSKALIQEEQPALYLSRHEFRYLGRKVSRTEVTAAVRIEELAAGVILPHEATRSHAKEDRLHLLRAAHTNISPVMLLYDGDPIQDPARDPLVSDLGNGERLLTWPITDAKLVRKFQEQLAPRPLYIADGHHRYETTLNYMKETKAKPGDAASYVMAALISFSDPGLLVLPYHRLLKGMDAVTLHRCIERTEAVCITKHVNVGSKEPLDVARMAMNALGKKALFAIWGDEPGTLSLMHLHNDSVVDEIAARGHSRTWSGLSNSIFREAILQPATGILEEQAESQGTLAFAKDALEAVEAVNSGQCQVAFLCKAIPFDAFKEVSDRQERLPPKSTFFYPKLPTGLVLKSAEGPLWPADIGAV